MSNIFLYAVLVIMRAWKFTTGQVFHHAQIDFVSVSTISSSANNVVAKDSRNFSFFPNCGGSLNANLTYNYDTTMQNLVLLNFLTR